MAKSDIPTSVVYMGGVIHSAPSVIGFTLLSKYVYSLCVKPGEYNTANEFALDHYTPQTPLGCFIHTLQSLEGDQSASKLSLPKGKS